MLYKIARLKCNKLNSILLSILSITLLFTYFQGGNLTEEYALPLITISLYIFLDYILNENINVLRLILCGICFGGVILLRINMASVWIVFCALVLWKVIKEKKYKELGKFIAFFSCGVGIIIIPVLIWLASKGALLEFWKDYIEFNKIYSSSEIAGADFANQWSVFFYFLNNTIIVFSCIIIAYFCKLRKNMLDIGYLIYIILTFIMISMSGRTYDHYGMILIPIIIYPFSLVYELLDNAKEDEKSKILKIIVSMYLIGVFIFPIWQPFIRDFPFYYKNRNKDKISSTVKSISLIIDEKTSENDRISVYGNWDIIYIISNRIHATKYSYQFPIGEVMPSIMDEYLNELKKELPKIIVVSYGNYDKRISSFLEENNYRLIWNETEDIQKSALVFERSYN